MLNATLLPYVDLTRYDEAAIEERILLISYIQVLNNVIYKILSNINFDKYYEIQLAELPSLDIRYKYLKYK